MRILKNIISVTDDVGNPGEDTTLVSEKGVRSAIDEGAGLLHNISEDKSPKLSGDLDMNGFNIGGSSEEQFDDAITKKHTKLCDTANFAKLDGIEKGATKTDIDSVGTFIHESTPKTTFVNADEMCLLDSAGAWILKKVTWANIKATLKTYFDTLYSAIAHKDTHDPQDGADPLDTAAAAEIAGVQAAGVGVSHSFARADHIHTIAHGIADNHLVTIDHAAVADNDYAKFTASGLEGREASEVLGDIGAPSKTTAAWSKSIGSGGDYATWAAMITDMPNLIAHAVTVTIKAGTTLTETCNLKNKHGLTSDAAITIQAEKYFPTSGELPTADSATATTLRDAALATAALGDDYFNGCWVFVVDGTGTNNGFVAITDYVDATGDIVVASWPGTQPDNTSRYLIVGALIDGGGARTCLSVCSCTCGVTLRGIGIYDGSAFGADLQLSSTIDLRYCGIYQTTSAGLYIFMVQYPNCRYNGVVKCNTANQSWHGGVTVNGRSAGAKLYYNGISDNNQRGIYVLEGPFAYSYNNFGDANGLWGAYAVYAGVVRCTGTECSGSSGNHSNGTGDGSLAY